MLHTCITIDDELHAVQALHRYIEAVGNLKLVHSFTDPLAALRCLSSTDRVSLVLLDIDMPALNGIELAKAIRSKTDKLIFTTGYTQYGYEAFRADADDYLLKPFSLAEFAAAINKLFSAQPAAAHPEPAAYFFVKSKTDQHKLVQVCYADVILVESKLNYVLIRTRTRDILTYMSLREMAAILMQQPGFLQFQRSYIIAQAHIDYVTGNCIAMSNGVTVTVGSYYRKAFSDFIDRSLIKTGRKH